MDGASDGAGPDLGIRSRETWIALAVAILATTVVAWGWVHEAATSLPHVAPSGQRLSDWARAARWADSSLIVWILSWVPHALGTNPTTLLGGNVLHPAGRSLLGSEALLSYVVLAGPLYAATGNAVLTANVTALATFALGGWLFYLVLRREGVSVTASTVAAVAVALGPMRTPPSVHVVQFSNVFFPLLLLAFQARRRAPLVFLAALAGFLSSFYLAAMVAALVAIELTLLARREGIARAVTPAIAVVAAAVPFLLLTFMYLDYAQKAAPEEPAQMSALAGRLMQQAFLDRSSATGIGWPIFMLAALGTFLPSSRSPRLSRARWIAIALVGIVVASGPDVAIGGHVIELPWALVRDTPLVALRSYDRFVILAQLGLAGLAAHGIDAILRRIPGAAASHPARVAVHGVVAALLLVAVTNGRAAELWATRMQQTAILAAGQSCYAQLRVLPPGPLLVVPGPASKLGLRNEAWQGDAMVASTVHWLPTINGHTRFRPWWFPQLTYLTSALNKRPEDLRPVVELTGLRWVLVNGDKVAPAVYERWKRAAAAGPTLRQVCEQDAQLLLEVTVEPQTSWREALARDPLPGHSALGTSLAPIPEPAARATVAGTPAKGTAVAGSRVGLDVLVRNSGTQTWPALMPPGADDGLVVLQSQWQTPDGVATGEPVRVRLPFDVLPGEQVRVHVAHDAPATPGPYRLAIRVVQVGGSPFASSQPLVVPVVITAAMDDAPRRSL